MEMLHDLPNLGPALERKLIEAGIETPQQLREAGSKDAFIRIRQRDNTACLHMLTALEGAVRGVRKTLLPPEVKAELNAFFKTL